MCWTDNYLLERCNQWPRRQSPYLHHYHYDVIRAFAAPVLIMTSFSLWHHSLLSWPSPALQTKVRYIRTPYHV